MNVPTLLAGVVVIIVIGANVFFQIRGRKKGKRGCSCGCDCAGCGMAGSCHAQK